MNTNMTTMIKRQRLKAKWLPHINIAQAQNLIITAGFGHDSRTEAATNGMFTPDRENYGRAKSRVPLEIRLLTLTDTRAATHVEICIK